MSIGFAGIAAFAVLIIASAGLVAVALRARGAGAFPAAVLLHR